MDTQVAFDILNRHVLAFGRMHLLNDEAPGPLLNGIEQPWSEATMRVKQRPLLGVVNGVSNPQVSIPLYTDG